MRIRPDTAYAWSGPAVLITNCRGECADDLTLPGFYFRETRYLATLKLEIDGELPWLCEIPTPEPNRIELLLLYPEMERFGGGGSGQSGEPVAPLELLVVDPALPSWLPEVVLHGLRLGQAKLTLSCWRDAQGSSHAEILEKKGTVRLLRQPPPESLSAGVTDRIKALAETILHH